MDKFRYPCLARQTDKMGLKNGKVTLGYEIRDSVILPDPG